MKKLVSTTNDFPYRKLPPDSVINTYISDEMPPLELCASSYSIVFKDGALLMTDLKEGERHIRMLDIPGGHIDEGETPEEAVVRETFEETGVRVKNPRLIAHKEVTLSTTPENWRYPCPTSYMLFFICEVEEEAFFNGNNDTHGRVWLPRDEWNKSVWCENNKKLLEEILRNI